MRVERASERSSERVCFVMGEAISTAEDELLRSGRNRFADFATLLKSPLPLRDYTLRATQRIGGTRPLVTTGSWLSMDQPRESIFRIHSATTPASVWPPSCPR